MLCGQVVYVGSSRCQDLGEPMSSHVRRDAFHGANHLIVDKSVWANFTHKYAKGRKPSLNNMFAEKGGKEEIPPSPTRRSMVQFPSSTNKVNNND